MADHIMNSDPYWDDRYEPEHSETECRHCGKAGLTWEHDGERWLLLDHHGEIHRCDPKRLAKLAAADFDDNSTRQDHS